MNSLSEPFRLRDRLVIPDRHAIQGPEGETGIEPKIMAVLCVLASEPGRVFTRTELIDRVWKAEYGADESLTRAISHLRKALGDSRSSDSRNGDGRTEQAMIETIAKRGYRLLPDAVSASETSLPAASLAAPISAQAGGPRPVHRRAWLIGAALGVVGAGLLWRLKPFAHDSISVTVLPVNPLRKEPSQVSLAKALTVDLVAALAKDNHLHVTMRRPGPKLPGQNPRYYTYIDLQTADGQLKAMAEIMDIDSDQALWSKLYERSYDGKLSSQDELAGAIARDMTSALLALARASSP